MKATINIRNILTDLNGPAFHVPAVIEIDEMLEFCEISEEQEIDVHDLLTKQNAIGIIWTTDHVKDQRPDLNDEQAWEVLQECQRSWDRLSDPMLETIRQAAENLFPKAKGKASLLARLAEMERRISALPDDEIENPAAYGATAAMIDGVDQILRPSRKE